MPDRLADIQLVEVGGQSEVQLIFGERTPEHAVARAVLEERRRVNMPDRVGITVKRNVRAAQWPKGSRFWLTPGDVPFLRPFVQSQRNRPNWDGAVGWYPARCRDQRRVQDSRPGGIQPDSHLG